MQTEKHKLKLRKGVIVSVPIALFITLFTIGLIINKNNIFSNTTEQKNVQSENKIEKIAYEENNDPGILSQNKYIQNMTSTLQTRKLDYTIVYYCNQFKLNTTKVLEIAHSLTNNYQDERYKQSFIIAPDSIRYTFGPYKSAEAGIVEFVRNIYRYPEQYGSNLTEIRSSEVVDTQRNIQNGHIILDSGLTFEQYLAKICEMYDIDKTLALAIVYEETGRMTSGLFQLSNNIGGQRGYAGWLIYPTLESGIIGFVVSLNNIIKTYNIDTTNPNYIYSLSSIYVSGHLGSPSASWTGKINNYMNTINSTNAFS